MFESYYHVDLVICIDKALDLSKLNKLKDYIGHIPDELEEEFIIHDKPIKTLRIKLIEFGGETSVCESPFFDYSEKREEFNKYLASITFANRSDVCNHGMEAMLRAIKSQWTEVPRHKRHIIMMFSSSHTLNLGDELVSHPYESRQIPKDYCEFISRWEGLYDGEGSYAPEAGRLALFVPSESDWLRFESLNRTIIYCGGEENMECGENYVLSLITGDFR